MSSSHADLTSITVHPDSSILDGAHTYLEGLVSVSIFVTVDAQPSPEVVLTRNDGMDIDFTKVFVTTSAIQFLGPLSGGDSGTYTLSITNAAGELRESFAINVQCKCKLACIHAL